MLHLAVESWIVGVWVDQWVDVSKVAQKNYMMQTWSYACASFQFVHLYDLDPCILVIQNHLYDVAHLGWAMQ